MIKPSPIKACEQALPKIWQKRREKKVTAFQTSLKVGWTQHRPTLMRDVIEVNNEQE